MSSFKILEYRERAESLYGLENKEITERDLEALLEGKRLWTDINWEYAITIRLKDRVKELELDKEIERLKSIIKEVKEYVIQEVNTINAITYINILDILDKENKDGERIIFI